MGPPDRAGVTLLASKGSLQPLWGLKDNVASISAQIQVDSGNIDQNIISNFDKKRA